MSRTTLFATLFTTILLLPAVASATCGSKTHASTCADGLSWSTTEGKCVPKVGS